MQVFVNGSPIEAQVKPLKPGVSLAQAEQELAASKDRYDTLGVRTAKGDELLIVTRSGRALSQDDHVRLDRDKVQVVFAENEDNRAMEVMPKVIIQGGMGAGLGGAAGLAVAKVAVKAGGAGQWVAAVGVGALGLLTGLTLSAIPLFSKPKDDVVKKLAN